MLFLKVLLFYFINLLFVILSINIYNDNSSNINIHFMVWGPGLQPNVVFPIQYFYIRYSNKDQKYPLKFVNSNLEVNIYSSNKKIPTLISDKFDCSFIVKYLLVESAHNLSISILYNGNHVADSPYYIKGVKNFENCYCPLNSFEEFKTVYNCSNNKQNQISIDFKPFQKINMDILRSKILDKFIPLPGSVALVHYIIKNNKIYRKSIGQHTDFKIFSDEILLSLSKKVLMPDMEFFFNLGDWPLSPLNEEALPIISWSGSNDTYDLILPTYKVMNALLRGYLTSEEDTLSVSNNRRIPWCEKSELAFFRGRDSSKERLELVRLSMKMPELIDARLTNMFFFQYSPDLGETKQFVQFNDFFKYKYQINMDGTVAAYRLPYLLGANSLVLKQDSKYYEFFYDLLKPFVHYVPFNRDLSNLIEMIQWSKDHENIVHDIIKNANHIIDEYLNPTELFCYHISFFEEYSKRSVSKVEIFKDMEFVVNDGQTCDCDSLNLKHDEL